MIRHHLYKLLLETAASSHGSLPTPVALHLLVFLSHYSILAVLVLLHQHQHLLLLLGTVGGRPRGLAVACGCAHFGRVEHIGFGLGGAVVGGVRDLSKLGRAWVGGGEGAVGLGSNLEVAGGGFELVVVEGIPLLMGH